MGKVINFCRRDAIIKPNRGASDQKPPCFNIVACFLILRTLYDAAFSYKLETVIYVDLISY